MITEDMVRSGIREHLITFIVDPNMGSGTVCSIGDSWFYFGGQEAEDAAPEEYLANTPLDDLVREVYEVLEEFDKDDDFRDEYAYYEAVLTYWNKYTEGNQVRLIF